MRWIEYTCETCGGAGRKRVAADVTQVRFCGDPCRLAWWSTEFRGEKSPHWRGGTPSYGPGWRRLSRYIAERDGHRCRACDRHEDELPMRLVAAHLTPRRSWAHPELADHPANLIALCASCHSSFDRKKATRYDYAVGDRPSWPAWTAQPVGLKVEFAREILALYGDLVPEVTA